VGSDGESIESLEIGDRDDPSNWYDMLAPELLSADVLDELATDRRAVVLDDGDHPVTVRLPRTSTEANTAEATDPISLQPAVEEYEIEPEYDIAASYLGSIIEDDEPGDVVVDHTGQYISYQPPEDGPESNNGSTRGESLSLPRNVFGDVVHKAVELGIDSGDESTIRRMSEQVAIQHDVHPDRLAESDVTEILRHVNSAVEYLNSLERDGGVDEKMVRATLDSGQLYGNIDHLSVTGDEYQVVDYKTNNISSPQLIDAKSEYYKWQMKAYAVALHQFNPDKHVEATLLFTEVGAQRSFRWNPGELAELTTDLNATVRSSLSGHF
jgi:ATP-dependent helicase/nuclease subunit A